MIIRRRFRPLGRMMQRFSRVHINNYTTTTNTASRVALPPDWQEAAEVPLNWPDYAAPEAEAEPQEFTGDAAPRRSRRAPAAPPAPQVQRQAAPPASAPRTTQPAATPQAAPPPGSPSMPVVNQTPPDLAALLARHRATYGDESDAPPLFQPSTDEPPARSRSRRPASAPGVQRRAAPPAAASDTTPAPPDLGGRRRGRVIEEITPPVEGDMLPSIEQSEPQAENPAWDEGIADSPDRPDLYEALVSEGIVRPAQQPDLSGAEIFTPPVQRQPNPPTPDMQRTAEDTPPATQTPPPPIRSRASLHRDSSPELPPAEPPATPRPPAPPTPPVQRAAAPEFSAEPDSDGDLESYTPEPGSTEADMLDILGLPPDTPIVDYRSPASSRPPVENTPPPRPPAPSTPATPPRVQRAEQQNPASPPVPSDRPRRAPDFLPEMEHIESEPPVDDTPFEPPLMRQPDMDLEAYTETYVPPVTDEGRFDQFDEFEPPPPAAENFTSFFEAAATPWADEPDSGPPARPAQPTVESSPPPSAPIQRAPADWSADPGDFDAGFEDFDEFEETQPTEPVQLPPVDQNPPDRPPRQVQRRAAPPAEPRYVPPLPMDDFGESDDLDDSAPEAEDTLPAASTRRSMPDTPPAPQPIRPAVPRLQRSTPPPPANPPAATNRPARPEPAAGPSAPSDSGQPGSAGYHIEGAESLDIGRASSERVYRAKAVGPSVKSDTVTVPSGVPTPGKLGESFPGKFGESPPTGTSGGNERANPARGPQAPASTTSPAVASNESPTSEVAPATEVSTGEAGQQGGAVNNEEQGQESSAPNIDKLARDVYNVLRDRLRIEQERRSRR